MYTEEEEYEDYKSCVVHTIKPHKIAGSSSFD